MIHNIRFSIGLNCQRLQLTCDRVIISKVASYIIGTVECTLTDGCLRLKSIVDLTKSIGENDGSN